jgi:hypothetical protein
MFAGKLKGPTLPELPPPHPGARTRWTVAFPHRTSILPDIWVHSHNAQDVTPMASTTGESPVIRERTPTEDAPRVAFTSELGSIGLASALPASTWPSPRPLPEGEGNGCKQATDRY